MAYPGHKLALGIAASVLVLWLAAMSIALRAARLEPEASGTMIVVFEPGTSSNDGLAKLIAADALPMRKTWVSFVWVAHGDRAGLSKRLMQQGALGTYRNLPLSPALSGCFAYSDIKMQELFSFR